MATATKQEREYEDGVEPRGVRIAGFRRQGSRGNPEEIRLSIDQCQGRPFIDVRVWFLSNGRWYPSKTSVTIRSHEIEGWQDALTEAWTKLEGVRDSPRRSGPARDEQPAPWTRPATSR